MLRKPLREYFDSMAGKIEEVVRNSSSEGGREAVSIAILVEINKFNEGFAEHKLKEARQKEDDDEFRTIVGTFEKALRSIIRKKFDELGSNWWEGRIPPDVAEKVAQLWNQKGKKGERLDLVDFSDYMRILSRNWKECFEESYKLANIDKNELSAMFRNLGKLRNEHFHFHGAINPPLEDIWRARLLAEDILKPLTQPATKPAANEAA
jgi:hypothetical protein